MWMHLAILGTGLLLAAVALIYGYICGYNDGQEAGRREL